MGETPTFASAAPVLKVDGNRVADLARDLVRLDIEESTEGLRTFTGHLLGSAPRVETSHDVVEYLDGKVLDFGKRLEVSLGPPGNEKIVFTGAVSALEVGFAEGDAPVVVVYAEDDLMKLRLTQRSATYLKAGDADLVRRIASDHGLSAEADVDGPHVRRGPAVQPERPGLPARAGPPHPGRAVGRRTASCTWPPGTAGPAPRVTHDPWQRPGLARPPRPTSPSSAPRSGCPGTTRRARRAIDARGPSGDRGGRDLRRAHRSADPAAGVRRPARETSA